METIKYVGSWGLTVGYYSFLIASTCLIVSAVEAVEAVEAKLKEKRKL